MRRTLSLTGLALLLSLASAQAALAACPGCKAEQVTTATANSVLFGGSDAAGGIGDWYLTNGSVVAIIDEIGTTPIDVLPSGTQSVDLTSSNTVETGGTVIDLGLKGKQNDQFPQGFNTGGLSLANVFIFRAGDETAWGVPNGNNPCASVGTANPACPVEVTIEDADPSNCSQITVYGIMLGSCKTATDFCSTRSLPKMRARTQYKMCKGSTAMKMRTEVWNQSGNAQILPIFDVFLWGGRGLVPFAPSLGRGFNHTDLDLSNVLSIAQQLTPAPFIAIPGNVNKKDGIMGRGKPANAVSYGYSSEGGEDDSNGPTAGGTLTQIAGQDEITSLETTLLSGISLNVLAGTPLANNASRIFSRRLIVGKANDVNSVLSDKKNKENILSRSIISGQLGTISGKVSPGSAGEGTITFIRTGGPNLGIAFSQYGALNSAPVTSVRTKGGFSNVLLPEGTYIARATFPGRDDVVSPSFTVTAAANTVVPPITLPKTGKLKIATIDTNLGTGIPAKVSLSPSPEMRRDINAFTFPTTTGQCSNNLNTACTNAAGCGGNPCYRTCTNVPLEACNPGCPGGFTCAPDGLCRQAGCSADGDCNAGYVCRAKTANIGAGSYPGVQTGGGQGQVIYTDKKGKAQVDVKPGTYTLTVSRGPEYTIQEVTNVAITAGVTTDGGIISLKRVLDTTGYLSADFHIHSGRSLDSSAPLEARVRSFAGEGLEVMISTDHDINTDYQPIIKKTGLGTFITSVVGTEVTTSVPKPPYLSNGWGHINSWPSVYDANLRRGGSIEDESVSLNTINDRLRAQSNMQCVGGKKNAAACTGASDCPGGTCTDVGEQVIQLNHPRAGLGGVVNIGLFDNIGYNPAGSINTCNKYPVTCAGSTCNGGTNDGFACASDAACTGGGKCSCNAGSIPGAANGCNNILRDLNVVPQSTLCTSAGCGGGFEGALGTRNIDADMTEIDNAGTIGGYGNLKLMRRDWMSLLNQGVEVGKTGAQHPLWGTGVSDSHRLVAEIPGYSRTYVGAGELPQTTFLDIKPFNQEILDGNMSVSAGPYITFKANDGGADVGMGSTITEDPAPVTNVNLKIKVQAAPWIPVDEVRLIKNGCVIACYNTTTIPALQPNPVNPFTQTPTAGEVTRFDATIPDVVTGDSYYIVEASPNLPMSGSPTVDPIVNRVANNVFPFAFTNPIFADADGDGDYTGITLAPNTGEPVCPALPIDCSAGSVVARATTAPSTMFAKATAPAPGFFNRLVSAIIPTAVAADSQPAPVVDDSERVRQHEEDLRKPNDEHVPWHLIEFPTPAPTPAH